ncbi:hypothetical protein EOW65_09165 [Sinirhodobacter ferrireducens]|uniref:Uncharacterized protein n=1 Tax=Paenirhodobacter ferrireducens TaxID=1215032 RepID=A0A443LJR2_9RHOB|nr:hypothetical protein [Sinirhodobacter ferrireducens]RWR49437.1 hypothetical protein EOW65_09165 [Sinirhodobacter ferrireducens]
MSAMAEAARPVGVSVQDWARLSAAQRLAAAELLAVRPAEISVTRWLTMGEAGRRAALLQAATAPEVCGPEIPVAPARGACRVFTVRQIRPGTRNTIEDAGYQGPGEAQPRRAVRAADVFDRMEARAQAAKKPAPFTPGQIAIARLYRTLVERHEAGAIKLSSLEGRTGGSGRGVDVTDLRLEDARKIALLRRRIGDGAAMVVRRLRPSARGAGASIILDRRLVDAVCLEDMDLSSILAAHGWNVDGTHRKRLVAALVASLDRMRGYPQKGD